VVAATVSHRWMFGSITAQLGALEVQMDTSNGVL